MNAPTSFLPVWKSSGGIFDIAGKKSRIGELEGEASQPDFWLANEKAQTTLREQARLPTDLRRRPAPTTPSGGRTSRLPPAPVQAPPVMNPTVLTRTVKALPVTAPPVTAPPVMTRQMTAPPETGLIAALPAFQKEVAIRAVIFVIAIACGVLTEVAVAGAIHGPSRTAQEESR